MLFSFLKLIVKAFSTRQRCHPINSGRFNLPQLSSDRKSDQLSCKNKKLARKSWHVLQNGTERLKLLNLIHVLYLTVQWYDLSASFLFDQTMQLDLKKKQTGIIFKKIKLAISIILTQIKVYNLFIIFVTWA